MAGEQILLPFPVDAEPEDPVSPEVYGRIVRARSVPEVCAAFRSERLHARRQEPDEDVRKLA